MVVSYPIIAWEKACQLPSAGEKKLYWVAFVRNTNLHDVFCEHAKYLFSRKMYEFQVMTPDQRARHLNNVKPAQLQRKQN